ncbi:MAG: CRR6 family NdhI maturation factor [Vulcanococcus sp.]
MPAPAVSSSASNAAPQTLLIPAEAVYGRSLAPLEAWFSLEPAALLARSGQLNLDFAWPRQADDPRELSEIPELRLWSLRADALCPWLPLLLERSNGQLTRHVAMLLPHQFSRTEGIRFAPDSLELWMTHRLFLLDHWCRSHGLNARGNLEQMAAVLGYELDASFWQGLD